MTSGKEVLVGTCGFSRSRRLIYANLDVVEIQETFYDPRPPEKYSKYREEAPPGFTFTVKAWMLVTHAYNAKLWRRLREPVPGDRSRYGSFQDTEEVWWAWETTLKAAEQVNAEYVVLQTPASFGYTPENLARVESFLDKAPRRGFRLAWEPRGDWWTRGLSELARLSEEYNIVVAGDFLRGRLPPRAGDDAYTRLHGLGGREVNYRYKYTDEDLERLASIISRIGAKRVFVLFNNVYSYDDAVRFKALLGKSLG